MVDILQLIWEIVTLAAYWKVFVKMGVPGWKGLIPIYGDYILFGKVWKSSKCWPYLISTILAFALPEILPDNQPALLLSLVLLVVSIVYDIKCCLRVAKSFGKSNGFGWGLCILEPIFLMILGLGKAEYLGNLSEENL